jgi:hypothetical protein
VATSKIKRWLEVKRSNLRDGSGGSENRLRGWRARSARPRARTRAGHSTAPPADDREQAALLERIEFTRGDEQVDRAIVKHGARSVTAFSGNTSRPVAGGNSFELYGRGPADAAMCKSVTEEN